MPLSVEQLVYTSFSGLGSRTLTSEKMPESIEQAFVKAVVPPSTFNGWIFVWVAVLR